jgi:hypothetical protein
MREHSQDHQIEASLHANSEEQVNESGKKIYISKNL